MFCEYCGKKLNDNEVCDCAESRANVVEKEKFTLNKVQLSKPALMVVVAVVAVVAVIGLVLAFGKEKIDLADYLSTDIVAEGIDSRGKVDTSDIFDDDALIEDLIATVSTDSNKELSNMTDEELSAIMAQGIEILSQSSQAAEDIELTYWVNGKETEKLEGLSNGDKIKIKASSKNADNDYFKVKFKDGTVEFTVEGLKEGRPVAAFENTKLEVSFVGVNGSGGVILNYNADAMPDIHVEFEVKDNTYAYSNGDQVEVVVKYDTYTWEQNGFYPMEESRIYTVEGLGSYVTSLPDVDKSMLDEMKTKAENEIKQQAEDDWTDGISIENISYVGECLLNKKEGTVFYGPENLLYMVYKIDVFENFAPNGGEDTRCTYYTLGIYEGIVMKPDGSINLDETLFSITNNTYMRNIRTSSSAWFGTSYVYYKGYETLEELLQENIYDHEDKYSCESTVTKTE